MQKQYTIEDMQSYASDKSGVCLSKDYKDATSKLKWRCEHGHTWDADFEIIRQGGWCPSCLKKQKDKEEKLEELKAIAIKKGGKCLSEEFIFNKTKYSFVCAEGHKFETAATGIFAGNWCVKCSYVSRGINQRFTVEMYQNIAKEHGGECLSTEYLNCFDIFEWKCAEGHIWKSTAHSIKRGTWCPKCSGQQRAIPKRDGIERYHKLAALHNGKCLSKDYINSNTKLEFQCDKGHTWSTDGANIKSGSWCPVCLKRKLWNNYKRKKKE